MTVPAFFFTYNNKRIMKSVFLLHLVTFVTFIPRSQMHHLVFPIFPQMGDQIKRAVILNKITNISGLEHCCKNVW